jgi:subtilisin-like proprotein convertase family protein
VADLTGAIVEGSELDNVLVERYGPRVSQGVSPNLAIPDLGGWVSSSLTVVGAPTSLLKATVTLQILHPATQDLVFHVASPAGTSVRLADLDGFGANYDGTAFDDDAPVGLGAGEAPFQGAYRPIEPLAKVAGEDPNGIWTLSIRDARGEEVGVLTWWVLDLW